MLLALVTAAVLCPAAYLPLAIALLLFHAYALFMPPKPGFRLPITLLTLLVLPLTLEPNIGALPAAAMIVLAIPLLNSEMREAAQTRSLPKSSKRRRPTSTVIIMACALLFAFILSFVLETRALTYTSSILLAYLAIIAAFIIWKIPASPLETSSINMKIVAGDTSQVNLPIKIKSKLPVLLLLETGYPWIHLHPRGLRPVEALTSCDVTITPPLSGPSHPALTASVTDQWGLIQTTQILEPVELHVTPKARYAAWLAKKYLEKATVGAAGTSTAQNIPEKYKDRMKGIEYQESRQYQPGDRLKDIDWKQSLKLREIITKEFLEGSGRTAVIVANLDAPNPEQADTLAYNLIASVLTMAMESIPIALAVYNHDGLIEVTKPENPRFALIKALNLTKNIAIYEPGKRFLAPPDLPRLRSTLSKLKNMDAEPARKLTKILNAEFAALKSAASDHPATSALKKVSQYVPPPALIAVLSRSADDTEAFAVTLDGLKKRGYESFLIEEKRKATARPMSR